MYRLYISTEASLNICNSSFEHVHFKHAPIYAICSLFKKWRKINMQTSLVKWLCIKNTVPPCMQQPFANIVAFFKGCAALLPNFKENPPMYVLNDFRNHSIPAGKCSMLAVLQDLIYSWITTAWFWKECHLADTLIETCVLPLKVQILACKVCNVMVRKCSKSLL